MPTFYAKSTTVQLSAADLECATTPKIRAAQGTEATESTRDVVFALAKASKDGTLSEIAINGPDGHHVQFLGENEDMPFFVVRAGKNFFDPDAPEKRNRRPARLPLFETKNGFVLIDSSNKENTSNLKIASIEPNRKYTSEQKPQALCLTVCLSNKSFVRTKTKRSDGAYSSDLKIDVFYNGHFCASDFIPRRFCGDASYGMTEHIVRFTGYRLARLVEKPWIFLPPDQCPDGKGRSATSTTNATHRWASISDALLHEADNAGRNKGGERSILGEYLESLSSQPMPTEAGDMQQAGHASFGVIDVIITYGQGAKDGPERPYLSKPTPMKIVGYAPVQKEQSAAPTPNPAVTTPASNPQPLPKTRSEALAMAKGLDECVDSPLEPPEIAPRLPDRITRSHALTNGHLTSRIASPTKQMLPSPLPSRSVSPTKPTLPPLVPKRRKASTTSTLVLVELPYLGSRASSINSNTPIEPPPKRVKTSSISLPLRRSQTPLEKKSRPSMAHSTSEFTSITVPISQPPRRSKQAMPYQHVWTNKQTLAEEMESIAAQAAEDTAARFQSEFQTLQESIPRATRASFIGVDVDDETEVVKPLEGSSPLSEPLYASSPLELGTTPKLTKIITLRYSSSPLKSGTSSPLKTASYFDQSGSSSPTKLDTGTTTPMGPPPTTRRKTLNSRGEGDISTPIYASSQKRRNRPEVKKPSAEALEAVFEVPELSRDCVVTYAEKGVLRNVGAVRGGKFTEVGVLMGVRFLVG